MRTATPARPGLDRLASCGARLSDLRPKSHSQDFGQPDCGIFGRQLRKNLYPGRSRPFIHFIHKVTEIVTQSLNFSFLKDALR